MSRSPQTNDAASILKSLGIDSGEAWTNALGNALADVENSAHADWISLITHCCAANSSKPTKKWLKQSRLHVETVGSVSLSEILHRVFDNVGEPGECGHRTYAEVHTYELDPTVPHDSTSQLLRGLIWLSPLVAGEKLIESVGNVAVRCFAKIAGFGPRSTKVGNACLWALSETATLQAVAQISRVKDRVKHASSKKQVAKALTAAATAIGISEIQLEEAAVPTLGFIAPGLLHRSVGDYTAVIEFDDRFKGTLRWENDCGKVQKSVPSSLKQSHAIVIKELKSTLKQANQTVSRWRNRLDGSYLHDRSWSLEEFRRTWIDHPLLGLIGRQLIWSVECKGEIVELLWHNGELCDIDGTPFLVRSEESVPTIVRLWHSSLAQAKRVLKWRERIEQVEVRQPFKQAHREVYLLTDAERRTATYSNRFAAHIVRQGQLAALCEARDWRFRLCGPWYAIDAGRPNIDLPAHNLHIEYWTEPIPDGGEYGTGLFLYLSTDQVRFSRIGDDVPLPVDQIPPLVFSEVMRTVDLFVGVGSIGADPHWTDGGPTGQFATYWENYSFGDLSATGKTRRELLEKLIPRLKIADRCTLDDKFLTVRGELHTYQIHCGSGNIQIAPHNRYLCIVPDSKSSRGVDKTFLPFEGDSTLSIILSKAMLLAEDHKITDKTILSQLRL